MTYATTATTSCVSYGSSLALSLPLLLLLLSTPLSHLGLITAPHSTLASLLGCIERVIRTAARLTGGIPRTGHVSAYMLDVLHWLPLQQRIMLSISAMVRWSLGVSWVLLRSTSEIFAVPPRAPEVAVHSAHRNRGYSLFLLPLPPKPRPVHSRWLTPLCGMGFLCRKDCSPGFVLTHFTLASKLFSLAVQGSGALLSSNLEGAL